MLESNKPCRRFLFNIVPEGREKHSTAAGKSRDRIGLNRRRVLVNWASRPPIRGSREFGHTRL